MSTGDKIRHKAEEMTGAAKEKIGDATDNERMQAEGAAQKSAARAKQAGDLAALDRQGHVANHLALAERAGEAFRAKAGGAGGLYRRRVRRRVVDIEGGKLFARHAEVSRRCCRDRRRRGPGRSAHRQSAPTQSSHCTSAAIRS